MSRELPWSFAVMEDDSVLCVDCVHEAEREVRGAQSLVRAWIDAGPGVCCAWCSVTGALSDGAERVHGEFRTVVVVGEALLGAAVSVTGTLPGGACRSKGGVSIGGDVRLLWPEQARELAAALVVVVERIGAVADDRYGAIGSSPVDSCGEG